MLRTNSLWVLTVNSAECLKELADLVYVCYQYAENLDWDLDDKALDRVHESNLCLSLVKTVSPSTAKMARS
jgi:hypothetical protein